MNYASLNLFDTQNGPGARVSLFVSGCTLACPGCFNREAQNFKHGKPFTGRELGAILEALREPAIEGLSLLGGDPCEPKNMPGVLHVLRRVRAAYPNKTIWLWTGRVIEDVMATRMGRDLLDLVDVVVDGPYVEALADPKLEHMGSSNQRIILINKSPLTHLAKAR